MTIGPVQMLVVGFDGDKFSGEILEELRRLREQDIVRLVDLLFVKKEEDGELVVIQASDLSQEEAMEFGATIGALIGIGVDGEDGALAGALAGAEAGEDGHVLDESEVWYLQDAIPPGGAAGIALLEHRWAIPLRDAIGRAGGIPLADEWIHATDLVAIGMAAAED